MRRKLSSGDFAEVLSYGRGRLRVDTGEGGYKSYFCYQEDGGWVAGYNEYIFVADGFPYDTVEYEEAKVGDRVDGL